MSSAHNPYGRICRRSNRAVEAKNTSKNASRTSTQVRACDVEKVGAKTVRHRELGILGDALVHVEEVPMPANDHCANISAEGLDGLAHLVDGDDRSGEEELRDQRRAG